MKPRSLALLLCLLPAVSFGTKMDFPIMPDVPPQSKTGTLNYLAIRAQLETVLPPGQKLILSGPPAAGAVGAVGATEEALPRFASVGRYPVIALSDHTYATVPHDFVPVLVDWFDVMVLQCMGLTYEQAGAAKLTTNKISRLMRVFMEVRMHRTEGTEAGLAPAIGWGQFYFNEDWGRYKKGGEYTVVVIATERGWIALDPYTRRTRPLLKNDPRWIMEFLVL